MPSILFRCTQNLLLCAKHSCWLPSLSSNPIVSLHTKRCCTKSRKEVVSLSAKPLVLCQMSSNPLLELMGMCQQVVWVSKIWSAPFSIKIWFVPALHSHLPSPSFQSFCPGPSSLLPPFCCPTTFPAPTTAYPTSPLCIL